MLDIGIAEILGGIFTRNSYFLVGLSKLLRGSIACPPPKHLVLGRANCPLLSLRSTQFGGQKEQTKYGYRGVYFEIFINFMKGSKMLLNLFCKERWNDEGVDMKLASLRRVPEGCI